MVASVEYTRLFLQERIVTSWTIDKNLANEYGQYSSPVVQGKLNSRYVLTKVIEDGLNIFTKVVPRTTAVRGPAARRNRKYFLDFPYTWNHPSDYQL